MSAELEEKEFAAIAIGSEARYLLAKMGPLFDAERKRLIQKLKDDYRAGPMDEIDMKVDIGMLCSLDHLEFSLKSHISKANRIKGEKLNDHKQSN